MTSPIPEPKLNGGLYNGDKFIDGAPWATVPVRPTSAYLTHVNLRSANPPPEALYQMQSGFRPGNNTDDEMPGIALFNGNENYGPFNFACIPPLNKPKEADPCNKCKVQVIPII